MPGEDHDAGVPAHTSRLYAEVVSPPRLNKVTGPAVATFLRDYAVYLVGFQEFVRQTHPT